MPLALRVISYLQLYFGDIFMYTEAVEKQLPTIGRFLGRLKKFGLKIAPTKCNILFNGLVLLGYHVSQHGIKPQKDKLPVFKQVEYPKNIKEALGFLNLFHWVIPDYTTHAHE